MDLLVNVGGLAMENFVTVKEVGRYLKLSDTTIYKLAARGELPGFKIGDSWRFDMDEIFRVIEMKKGKEGVMEK
jgi:excisionase family DNA binding protein